MGIALVEHPLDHGPGHDREPRDEVMLAQGKTANAVVAVRNDARAARKLAHLEAVRRGVGAETAADFGLGLRMEYEINAGSGGGARSRMVVGRRAYAAETEHDVRPGERTPQRSRDQFRVVAQVLAPGERKAAAAQNRDQLRHVLVLALAAHDFIADDNGADSHRSSPPRCLLGRNRLFAQLRQPRQAIVDESEPAVNRREKPEQWNQPEQRDRDT